MKFSKFILKQTWALSVWVFPVHVPPFWQGLPSHAAGISQLSPWYFALPFSALHRQISLSHVPPLKQGTSFPQDVCWQESPAVFSGQLHFAPLTPEVLSSFATQVPLFWHGSIRVQRSISHLLPSYGNWQPQLNSSVPKLSKHVPSFFLFGIIYPRWI